MNRTIHFSFILGLIFILVGGAFHGYAQVPLHATCPVMPGNRVKEKFFIDYEGKRIYLCCRACVKAFKRHPEKYIKNLKGNEEEAP